MNQFFTLSTDKFVPISYDNKHLFNTYELVNNFIRTRISASFKNILAKPILENHQVDWYSPFSGLKETVEVAAQRKYFAFKDELQQHIANLSRSNDPNAHYWVGLLQKVFEQKNNILFTNGQDICVVWGWAFDNYQIQRPEIDASQEKPQEAPMEEPPAVVLPPQEAKPVEAPTPEPLREEPPLPEEEEEETPEEETPEEEEEEEETPEEPLAEIPWQEAPLAEAPPQEQGKSFLEFLKEFAATYWWFLVLLLALISAVFFVQSFIY